MRAYWEMSSGTKSWAGRPTNRRKKPYKIVLENVTQEKKKLQSIVSLNVVPPISSLMLTFTRFHIMTTLRQATHSFL